MNSKIGNPQQQLETRTKNSGISTLAKFFISFLFLLAPIKFGSVLDSTSIGFYPLSLLEWFFSPWPSFIMPVLTGLALILSLVSATSTGLSRLEKHKFLLLPIALLFFSSLIGLVHTTEKNYAYLFMWHILGILNFAIAVFLQTLDQPRSKNWFLVSLMAGSFYVILLGIVQITTGFEATKEYAQNLVSQNGIQFSTEFENRLNQRRAYASFTYPNSFAAHLILVIPLLLTCTWTWAKSVSPPRQSQFVLTSLAGTVSGILLFYTGSRGALCGLFISLCLFFFWIFPFQKQLHPKNKRVDVTLITTGLFIVLITMVFITFKGRSFASIDARLDYYQAACSMFLQHPLVGIGLGEFYPWYLRLKPPGAEETRLAHNLFLHFLAQCGLLGGLSAAFFLANPIVVGVLVYKKKMFSPTNSPFLISVLLGSFSWSLHSLTDFNVQIPGTLLIVVTLPMLVIQPEDISHATRPAKSYWQYKSIFLVLATIGIAGIWRIPGELSYQRLYNKCLRIDVTENLLHDAERVSTLLPFSPYPWDIVGKKALTQNRIDLATQAFEEAIKRTPHRAGYHAYLAQCYLNNHEISKAKHHINQALLWYPHEPKFKKIKDFLSNL